MIFKKKNLNKLYVQATGSQNWLPILSVTNQFLLNHRPLTYWVVAVLPTTHNFSGNLQFQLIFKWSGLWKQIVIVLEISEIPTVDIRIFHALKI